MTYDIAALAQQILQSPKRCGNVTLVTIDGPAGSGKTTLAKALNQAIASSAIIPMDDLYNGWSNALAPELWERIQQLIVQPLSQGRAAQYNAFNWVTNTFDNAVEIEPTEVIILEGVGSSHPEVTASSSLNIWISASDDLLLNRVLERDGSHIREEMLAWQAAEREYFTQLRIEAKADIHLSSS